MVAEETFVRLHHKTYRKHLHMSLAKRVYKPNFGYNCFTLG